LIAEPATVSRAQYKRADLGEPESGSPGRFDEVKGEQVVDLFLQIGGRDVAAAQVLASAHATKDLDLVTGDSAHSASVRGPRARALREMASFGPFGAERASGRLLGASVESFDRRHRWQLALIRHSQSSAQPY